MIIYVYLGVDNILHLVSKHITTVKIVEQKLDGACYYNTDYMKATFDYMKDNNIAVEDYHSVKIN